MSKTTNHGASQAFIGMGSNIEPETFLPLALEHLKAHSNIHVVSTSPVYQTPPWGVENQADFLNAVLEITTDLPPYELLDFLLSTEKELKRIRKARWGPRTMDLDLLAYGTDTFQEKRLQLPHPRMHLRAFVLVPMRDIAPYWRHPALGATCEALLAHVDQAGIKKSALRLG